LKLYQNLINSLTLNFEPHNFGKGTQAHGNNNIGISKFTLHWLNHGQKFSFKTISIIIIIIHDHYSTKITKVQVFFIYHKQKIYSIQCEFIIKYDMAQTSI